MRSFLRLSILIGVVQHLAGATAQAQVGIGTNTPHSSAILHLHSTARGFLPPAMTTTEMSGIVGPAEGLVVFNTTLNQLFIRSAGAWQALGPNVDWGLAGNTLTGSEFIGSLNNQALVFRTNNTERMRLVGASGSVGIGTTTPSTPLHVAGEIRLGSTLLTAATAGSGAMRWTGSQMEVSNGTNWVVQGDNLGSHTATTNLNMGSHLITGGGTTGIGVSNAGHVGIGITPSSTHRLMVNDPGQATLQLTFGAATTPTDGFLVFTNNTSAGILNREATPLHLGTHALTRMTILADGNVGIGTTTPSVQLDVVRSTNNFVVNIHNPFTPTASGGGLSVSIADGNHAGSFIRTGATSTGPVLLVHNQNTGSSGTAISVVDNGSGTALEVNGGTGNLAHFNSFSGLDATLTSAGRLGIGTSAPTTPLHVAGEIRLGSTLLTAATAGSGAMRWNGTQMQVSNGSAWVNLAADNLGSHLAITNLNMGSHLITGGGSTGIGVSNAGRVGIGITPSSTHRLMVNDPVQATLQLTVGAATTPTDGFLVFTNSSGAGILNREATPLHLGTTAITQMTILADGRVGIGTTAPAARLHVNGSVAMSENTFTNPTLLSFTHSYYRYTGATGSLVLGDGTATGQILVIENAGGVLTILTVWDSPTSNNTNISSSLFGMDQNDFITLMWNGVDWMEISRSAN